MSGTNFFRAHCLIAYGSQLWDFQNKLVGEFAVAWRKCVRRVWGLSNMTHCNLLNGITLDRDIEWQLLSRSITFIRSAVSSSNKLLLLCGNLVVQGSSSSVSNTMSKLSDTLSLDRQDIAFSSRCLLGCDRSTSWRTGAIRDFAIARSFAVGDDLNNLNDIIVYLGTE